MLTETRPLKRLKTAVDACTLPSTKAWRSTVQKLCGSQDWDVQQKVRVVKRNAEQLHTALVENANYTELANSHIGSDIEIQ